MLKESRNLHREDTVRNIKAKLRLSGQTRPAGIHHHQAGTRNIKKELFRLKDMIDPSDGAPAWAPERGRAVGLPP